MPYQKKNDGVVRTLPIVINESDEMRKAWERYWELGTERSYQRISKEFNRSLTTVAVWARSWNWQQRLVERQQYVAATVAKDVIVAETQIATRGMQILDDWENRLLKIAVAYLDKYKEWVENPNTRLRPEDFEKVARIVMDIKQPKELKQNNAQLPTIINIIPHADSGGTGSGNAELHRAHDGRSEIIEVEAQHVSDSTGGDATS